MDGNVSGLRYTCGLHVRFSETAMAVVDKHAAVPAFLSLNAGYVDTAGFLALQGLFTAHVTGNFVTLGAALVLGTSGILAKLLALPVFCVVVLVTRLLAPALPRLGLPVLRTMLSLKLVLPGGGAAEGL